MLQDKSYCLLPCFIYILEMFPFFRCICSILFRYFCSNICKLICCNCCINYCFFCGYVSYKI